MKLPTVFRREQDSLAASSLGQAIPAVERAASAGWYGVDHTPRKLDVVDRLVEQIVDEELDLTSLLRLQLEAAVKVEPHVEACQIVRNGVVIDDPGRPRFGPFPEPTLHTLGGPGR